MLIVVSLGNFIKLTLIKYHYSLICAMSIAEVLCNIVVPNHVNFVGEEVLFLDWVNKD